MKTPKLFLDATELSIKKSQDYNGGIAKDVNDPRTEYFPFGEVSYGHFIIHKAERLKKLITLLDNGKDCSDHIKQELMDLVNYCSYLYSYMDDKNNERTD